MVRAASSTGTNVDSKPKSARSMLRRCGALRPGGARVDAVGAGVRGRATSAAPSVSDDVLAVARTRSVADAGRLEIHVAGLAPPLPSIDQSYAM